MFAYNIFSIGRMRQIVNTGEERVKVWVANPKQGFELAVIASMHLDQMHGNVAPEPNIQIIQNSLHNRRKNILNKEIWFSSCWLRASGLGQSSCTSMRLTAEKLTLAPKYFGGHAWSKSRVLSMDVRSFKLIYWKQINIFWAWW